MRREHPIPESLGNDDLILPAGFVCDACNQYFGSKIEQEVLQKAPFGVERVAQAIRSKKGRFAALRSKSLHLQSTGYWDRVVMQSEFPHASLIRLPNGQFALNPEWATPSTIARFLLKMGLGLLVLVNDIDPYAAEFDEARRCARFGKHADHWDFALGIYKNRRALTISTSFDHLGPLETRQIYQYEIGVMESGDVVLNFVFSTTIFAINLSRPAVLEYVLGFNNKNETKLESRWQLFRGRKRSRS